MKLSSQLIFLISLIIIQTLINLLNAINVIRISESLFQFYYIIDSIFRILIILYLYFFVVNYCKQELSFIPFFIIVAVIVFNYISNFYIIVNLKSSDIPLNKIGNYLILIIVIPSFVSYLSYFIIARQLVRNLTDDPITRHNITLIGRSIYVMIISMLVMAVISTTLYELPWLKKISYLIYALPLIFMAKLYWRELRKIKADYIQ